MKMHMNVTPERKRLAAGAAVLLVGALGLIAATTGAFQTDQKTITDNEFQSGAIALNVGITTMVFPHPLEPMSPGDKLYAPILVSNTGTIPLRWSMSSLTTEDVLASALRIKVKSGAGQGGPAGVGTDCTPGAWDGPLWTAGIMSGTPVTENDLPLGSTAAGGSKIIGDPATGMQYGDTSLGSLASTFNTLQLCVEVSYPADAPAAADGKTTNATFIFDAESANNNF